MQKNRKEAHKVLRQEKRKMEKEKIEKLEIYRYNPKEFIRQCKTLKKWIQTNNAIRTEW